MLEWLKRKSREKSAANIRMCVENLIAQANAVDAVLVRTGSASPAEIKAVTKAKESLVIQLCGPIPLDTAWETIVDPTARSHALSPGAIKALEHTYILLTTK